MPCIGFIDTWPAFGPQQPPLHQPAPVTAQTPISTGNERSVQGALQRPCSADLNDTFSETNWNGCSEVGMFSILPLELRDRIWEGVFIRGLNKNDAKICHRIMNNKYAFLSKFERKNGIDYFHQLQHIVYSKATTFSPD
jgi:hypothetical protein